MGRSIKKGPYVQEVLLKRVKAMNEAGEKKVPIALLGENEHSEVHKQLGQQKSYYSNGCKY